MSSGGVWWRVEVELRGWPRWPRSGMRRLANALRTGGPVRRVAATSNAPWLRLVREAHATITVEVAAAAPHEAAETAVAAVDDALRRIGRTSVPSAWIISTDGEPAIETEDRPVPFVQDAAPPGG